MGFMAMINRVTGVNRNPGIARINRNRIARQMATFPAPHFLTRSPHKMANEK